MDTNEELDRIIFELTRITTDLKELNDKLEQEDQDE